MKLIIDISKATQKIIHDHGEVGIHMSAEKLLEAIQDSIPLDTHDELVIETTVKSIWGKPPYMELLDKIRTEMIDNAKRCMNDTRASGLYMAVNIVSKYIGKEQTNKEVSK